MNEFLHLSNTWVQRLLTTILEPLTNLSFGFFAASGLLLLMLFSLTTMIWRLLQSYRQLSKAIKLIEKYSDERDFTKNFEFFSEQICNIKLLKHTWVEYQETLLRPLEDTVDDPRFLVYRNTRRPQDFFSEKSIIANIKPGIKSNTFIGFGLLLTFAGLVAALNESGQAFSGNADEVKAALASLLAVAGAKFLASIGGLGCAVIQDIAAGFMSRAFAKPMLKNFNQSLEKRLQFVTVASIAAEQYGHAQRQTQRLEELSDQLATRLGERFEQAIGQLPQAFGQEIYGAMQSAIKPVSAQLSSFTGNMANSNTEALGDMAQNFIKQLNTTQSETQKANSEQLEKLASGLSSSIDALSLNNSNLEKAAENFEQSLTTSTSTMSSGLEMTLQHVSETIKRLANDIGSQQQQHLEVINSTQQAMVSQFQETMDQQSTKMTTALSTMRQVMEESSQQAGAKLSQSLETSALATAHQVEKISLAMSDQIGGALTQSSTDITQAIGLWRQHTEHTCTALNEMNNSLTQHADTLRQADDSLTQLHHTFNASSYSVQRALEPLNEQAKRFEQVSQNTEKTASSLLKSTQSMEQAIAGLDQQWQLQSQQLAGADQELEQAFGRITHGLEKSLGQLDRFTGQLGDNLTNAITELSGLSEILNDNIEELNDALTRRSAR